MVESRAVGLQLYELFYNLGYLLHRQGDWTQAQEQYQHSIALNPNYAVAYHTFARLLEEQGNTETAIEFYQRALTLDPHDLTAYNNFACLLMRQGEVERAIQLYQRAIHVHPQAAILYSNLGQALIETNLHAGLAALQRSIELEPDLVTAHYNLGRVWQQTGHTKAAIAAFERVLQLHPDHPSAWSDCTVAWLSLGQVKQALVCLRQAILPYLPQIQAYCSRSIFATSVTKRDELTQTKLACVRFLRALQQEKYTQAHRHLAQIYLHRGNILMIYPGEREKQYHQAELFYQQALRLKPYGVTFHLKLARCLIEQRRLATVQPQKQEATAQLSGFYQSIQGWLKANQLDDRYSLLSPNEKAPLSLADLTPQAIPLTLKTCAGLNCKPCLQRICQDFNVTQLRQNVYHCLAPSNHTPLYPRFLATVPQGRVWSIPQQNNWLICNAIAVLSPDYYLLADVSRDYPGQLPPCQQPQLGNHLIFRQKQLPTVEQIEGKVAVVNGLSGNNYYHWMVDILPRLAVLRQGGVDFDQVDWFLINTPSQPFQQATLDCLGIPPQKVLSSDRHPYIQASELIVPSFAGHLGWLESWSLKFLRQTFLPLSRSSCSFHPTFPERLYISRGQANHRCVLNEAAVIKELQHYGFVAVSLEQLSLAEQIALFS